MDFRRLSTVLLVLALVASADTLLAQAAPCSSAGSQQQVMGQTVVCDEPAKPAPLVTWWANSGLGNFCRAVARDTKRNNCWPEPFVRADRLAVRMPFVLMVSNGWRRQNTMGDHHFDPETGKLNQDGRSKIRHILLQGLPQHRTLWVHRSERAAETAARVDAVQSYAAQTLRDGSLPQVFETDIPAIGWPAQRVYAVAEKWNTTTPDPRLPKSETGEATQ